MTVLTATMLVKARPTMTAFRRHGCRTYGACAGQSHPKFLEIINPSTGLPHSFPEPIPIDGLEDVKTKFNAASEGQKRWARTPLEQRKAVLTRFSQLLRERTDALASSLTLDMGKPIKQAAGEVRATVRRVQFGIDNIDQVLADLVVQEGGGLREVIAHEPLGVVANISAWNYPFFVSSNVFVPALLAGNAVLFKPSEHASVSGMMMARTLHEAGVPEDVFIVTTGDGKVTGAAVASLPSLGGLFFTGSYATGKLVAMASAPNMVKTQLELGGKDPVYVRPDVDVATAAASLVEGKFYNCGQSCCAVERIYVHKDIFRPFLEAYVAGVKELKMGDPMKADTTLGPLAQRRQLAFLDDLVADALSKGAQLLLGGARAKPPKPDSNASYNPEGNYFEPTEVSGDEEALRLMADTEYGLTAGVYTKDRDRALAILRDLDVGTGYWNCCDRVAPTLPWSGRRHSGIGCVLSVEGMRSFVRPKALHLKTNI
eukprot:jgi/Mesvir1/1182/Mv17678-RA.1